MAMYRPGAIAAFITGTVVGSSGSAFQMLARSVVMEATVSVRDVTADGDTETQYVNNGLVGGLMRLTGWADSGAVLRISELQGENLTGVLITIIPTSTAAERIDVICTIESVRVAYEKTSVGVAVSLGCRISDINHDS